MSVSNIKINGISEGIGYDCGTMLLSWKTVSSAETQKNASVTVSDEKGNCVFAAKGDLPWEGTRLDFAPAPRTCYKVEISVTDSNGGEHKGESFFESGKMDEPWQARWISPVGTGDWAPTLKGSFSPEGEVEKARLYILGLGVYEARLNGERISDELLAPGYWYYEKEAPCRSLDVTELIRRENSLEVTLGKGWYMGRFGIAHEPWSDRYALLAELRLSLADGREQIFVSDESWTWTESSISAENSIYDGEKLDALAHEDKENEPQSVECIEAPLKAVDGFAPPVTEQECLKVAEVIHTPAGETVLDFGQNHAGLLRFRSCLPRGAEVHFDFGEVLQQGNFYNENYRSALGGFTYRSDGEEKWISQSFTFFGFRYVRVSGWVGEVRAEDFESPVIYTALDRTGFMDCGHKLVNRLYENTLWSQRSNFISMPTDCPQRDERLGWTGDAQVFAPTANYNMDCRAFYRSFLRMLRLDQLDNGGSIAVVLPRAPGFASCAVWGDAATMIPDTLMGFTGLTEQAEEWYPMMRDWVDYVESKSHGYLYDDEQLGDWLALDGVTDQSFKGGTDDTYLGSLYFMGSARIVSALAMALGKTGDGEKYALLAENIRNAVLETYFTPAGRLSVDTQAGYISALRFGVWRDKDVLIKQFMRRMRFDGFEIRCGFVGAPLMCSVLAEHGMEDLAMEMLLNRGFPGWLHCVELGATTIWERWNSLLSDGSCSGTGMNSFNHYAYGSVMEYVYGYVAGIRPGSRGFRNAVVAPQPDVRLGYMNCSVDSVSGKYVSNWRIESSGELSVHIEVPFGCTATVTLPRSGKESFTLAAGSYDWRYMPVRDFRSLYSMESRLSALRDDEAAKAVLLQEAPALFGVLMENNREFTTQTLRELGGAFFLGMNPGIIEKVVERLSELNYSVEE